MPATSGWSLAGCTNARPNAPSPTIPTVMGIPVQLPTRVVVVAVCKAGPGYIPSSRSAFPAPMAARISAEMSRFANHATLGTSWFTMK